MTLLSYRRHRFPPRSSAGFPFARYGGSCPRWVVNTAFMKPGVVQVQAAELPDGAAYLAALSRYRGRPESAHGGATASYLMA